jgi:hypothetical protein
VCLLLATAVAPSLHQPRASDKSGVSVLANLAQVGAPDGRFDEQLALARDELARLVRRLRNLSPTAWTARRAPVLLALSRLAAVGALAEQRAMPELPEIADHALADAMAVIGSDVIFVLAGAPPDNSLIESLIAEIDLTLIATR